MLEESGFAKITIDNLCASLGVTKGSFYHHFKNINAYTAALMEYWLKKNTLDIIRQADQAESEKSTELNSLVSALGHKSELHIRAWSFSHAIVRDFVAKADQIRLEYLTAMFVQMGHDYPSAKDQALLEYATLIGVQHLAPDLPADEWRRLQEVYRISGD